METKKSSYSFSNAVTDLRNARFHAEREAFGFSIFLQDSKAKYYVECGHEHDGGISISVDSGTPPVRWFVRPSVREMVDLLIAADQLLKAGQVDDWLSALNKIEPMINF